MSILTAAYPASDLKNKYVTYKDDPLQTRIYTLDNGLKVYMAANRDEPRIQTMIAVKAGSKNDPSETTGLAHYLEHMLFKGTDQIGSTNWKEEKKYLDQISELYEQHRETEDADEKLSIYSKIDSLSSVAAKYVAANEYDKLISSLGAKGTNAYTSVEQTVYINDIPSNEIEKWLQIESERFSTLVLRLFHTELETVYEEFNRGQDNDYRQSWKSIYEGLFKNHPYGTQTTIGEGEHLKNPSMVNIHKYFDEYYVPNNMAICLAGDIDFDRTIELIEEYFGEFEAGEVPEFSFSPEQPMPEPMVFENYGSQAEHLYMAWRFDGASSEDALKMRLVSGLLANGQAGLFDLNLRQQQKVLEANSYPVRNMDYSAHVLFGVPADGRSLAQTKDLFLGEIEKLKKGDFEDWLIDAVIRNFKYDRIKRFESNRAIASHLVDHFVKGTEYEQSYLDLDRMAEISKQEIQDFVQAHYQDNYVVSYKYEGENENVHKVEKPAITPIEIDRDAESKFAKKLLAQPSDRIEASFLDYKKDIDRAELKAGIPLYYIKNETNKTFKLYYILDMGSDHSKKLPVAVKYLQFLGTPKFSASALQQEFFKLGLSFDVFSDRNKVYVSLSGLEESMSQGVELFEHILKEVQPDQGVYDDMVKTILKEREDNKKDKGTILRRAMVNYAKHGAKSPFTDILSEEELVKLEPADLVNTIKKLSSFEHRVFYYGTREKTEVVDILNDFHRVSSELSTLPERKEYEELAFDKNEVYFVDYDQKQVEIFLVSKDEIYNKEIAAAAYIFNEYFGTGLSSIVFQEIREAKALAYSAFSFFTSPRRKEESHYVYGYIGTQADKLNDAVESMLELMNNIPEAIIQFEAAKDAALKKIETDRVTRENVYWNYETAKSRGLDYDLREDIYNEISSMSFEDLRQFFNGHVKGKQYKYLVLGSKENVDLKALENLGKVQELSLETIFNY